MPTIASQFFSPCPIDFTFEIILAWMLAANNFLSQNHPRSFICRNERFRLRCSSMKMRCATSALQVLASQRHNLIGPPVNWNSGLDPPRALKNFEKITKIVCGLLFSSKTSILQGKRPNKIVFDPP